MPKQLTRLTVFVSGSAETEAEKAALRTALSATSDVLEKTHGITLRLIGWPDTIRPGAASDPQSVINQQIGDDYDIYVGILGTRFGTPTPRAASGTEEEFRQALDRFRNNTTSVRLLFYFKRAAQDPFALDLEQMEKVRLFRQDLTTQGVLYRDFEDTARFSELIRAHIHHAIVDEWMDGAWRPIPIASDATSDIGDSSQGDVSDTVDTPKPTAAAEAWQDNDAGAGLLDLVDEFENATKALNEILPRLMKHTEEIGRLFRQRTDEANALMAKGQQKQFVGHLQQQFLAQAKAISNQSADDIEHYATKMAVDLQDFKVANRTMFHTLMLRVVEEEEFSIPPERRKQDLDGLLRLQTVLEQVRDQTTNFQASVSRMPPLTAAIKKARKRAAGTIGELVAELQFAIQALDEVLVWLRSRGRSAAA